MQMELNNSANYPFLAGRCRLAVGGAWGGGAGRGMLDVSGHLFKPRRQWRKPARPYRVFIPV